MVRRGSSVRAVVVVAAVMGSLVLGLTPSAGAASAPAGSTPTAGQGTAVARSVNVATLSTAPQFPEAPRSFGPLGIDGNPANASLPDQVSATTEKPADANGPLTATDPSGPNAGSGVQVAGPLIPTNTVRANFDGVTQDGSNCGGCQPPDPGAAVSTTQIAETVNLRLQVYNKSGGALCGFGLNSFLGTSRSIADPHIQWDNANNRFSMVVSPVPATTTATPRMFLATSQTSDACGFWWVYDLSFFGSLYPVGTLLDYPYLGQDSVSLLSSSNNFRRTAAGGFTYVNSAVFSISKAAAYAGAPVNFPAFATGFSTAPVTVTGIPITATGATYYLRSIPGTGYQLYRMVNSGRPGTTLTPLAVASSAFTAPTRRVRQPGTSTTLDPLDGRIQAPPFQDEGFVWFTHAQNLGGFPAVRYGAISTGTNTVTAANVFHSGTSDDFNPSIGVADAGAGVVRIWLNWAYTDTPAGRATSVALDGVNPGAGVPALIGTNSDLVIGSSTSSNRRFGDLSSVTIDPSDASASCPAGRTAVIAQQYFSSNGQWATRIGRISFC
jgi:hypothetical protein